MCVCLLLLTCEGQLPRVDPRDQLRLASLLASVFTYLAVSPALK